MIAPVLLKRSVKVWKNSSCSSMTKPSSLKTMQAALSSVNCGFTANGRPIGLQISGRRFADLETLQLTAWYEAARPASATPLFPS